MTGNIVSRRYAKALFALGKKQGEEQLAQFGKELTELAEVLSASAEGMRFFRNPLFSPAEKKAVLAKLLDDAGVDQMVRNFCELLADKDRVEFLPEIAADYQTMLDEAQGVVRGELITAYALNDGRKDELKQRLEKQVGAKLVLDFETDESILGGVMLKIGDKVLDASLNAQLQMLKDQIKRGE